MDILEGHDTACGTGRTQASEMYNPVDAVPAALCAPAGHQQAANAPLQQQAYKLGCEGSDVPLDAAATGDHEVVSDDMLIDHLTLANSQLRYILESAGFRPEPPLQPELQNHHGDETDAQVAVLAEENYQLRQLMQQLQLQQQLQQLQKQQEQLLLAAQGDPLELDRFTDCDCLSPQAVAGVAAAPENSLSLHRRSASCGAILSSIPEADLCRQVPLTPRSPAVLGGVGLLAPLNVSAVQLAEAEAAAHLATQAAIQAEAAAAAASDNMEWRQHMHCSSSSKQQQLPDLYSPTLWPQQPHLHAEHALQPVQEGTVGGTPLTAEAVAAVAAAGHGVQQQHQHNGSSSAGFGLLRLPKLMLPGRALRRSFSQEQHSESDMASDTAISVHSNTTSVTSRSSEAPRSACPGALASAGCVASGSVGMGLKQLANDLLLVPPALCAAQGPGGIKAAVATSGTAAAAAGLVLQGELDVAASVAASAAAGMWHPRGGNSTTAAEMAADLAPSGLCSLHHSSSNCSGGTISRSSSPSSKAAALVSEAVQGLQYPRAVLPVTTQQPQPQQAGVATAQQLGPMNASGLCLKAIRVSNAVQLPVQSVPASNASSGAAAAARAGAAAAAFAAQQPQEATATDGLPALPRLRVIDTRGCTAETDSTAAAAACKVLQGVQATAHHRPSAAAAGCAGAAASNGCSPHSDSGFFRTCAAEDPLLMLEQLESSMAGPLDSYASSEALHGSRMSSDRGCRMSSDLFGTRISMDGSAAFPRGSFSGSDLLQQLQQQQILASVVAGWDGDDEVAGTSEQSEWLGISYQQHGRQLESYGFGNSSSSSRQLHREQAPCQQQQIDAGSSNRPASSYARRLQEQQRLIKQGASLPPSVPEDFFYDSLASYASDSLSSQVTSSKVNHAFQLATASPAVFHQAGLDRLDSENSFSRQTSSAFSLCLQVPGVAESTAITAATDCSCSIADAGGAADPAEAAARQHHQHSNNNNSSIKLSDLSMIALQQGQHTQQSTPVLGVETTLSYTTPPTAYDLGSRAPAAAAAADAGLAVLQPGFAAAAAEAIKAAADCCTGGCGAGVSSEQLTQLLTDLEHAQQASAVTVEEAGKGSNLKVQASSRINKSPFAAAVGAANKAAVELPLPQLSVATPRAGVASSSSTNTTAPVKPTKTVFVATTSGQHPAAAAAAPPLQRAYSAGLALGAQLPPRWGMRSSGSVGNLSGVGVQLVQQQQQQQQRDGIIPVAVGSAAQKHQEQQHHANKLVQPIRAEFCQAAPADAYSNNAQAVAAAGCGTPAAAAAVPVLPVTVSPRLGGIHSRLRVVTAMKGQSTGSNSDADTNSATTTPVHAQSSSMNGLRVSSSNSLQLRGNALGLCSITVPPSPASSGVRYMPASPRVVGFECPSTPHAVLRSPSWRNDIAGDPNTPGAHSSASMSQPGSGVPGAALHSFSNTCGSGSSTPRRQPTSPGLLHQALARQGHTNGHTNGGSSGSSTPCGNRRPTVLPTGGLVPWTVPAAGASTGNLAAGAAAVHNGANCTTLYSTCSSTSNSSVLPGGPARARSCSSSTLMMMLTGGQLLQQQVAQTCLQHAPGHGPGLHRYAPVYGQQLQPLPLQQQQHSGLRSPCITRVLSDSHAYRHPSYTSAAEDAGAGDIVAAAVEAELRAADESATSFDSAGPQLPQEQHGRTRSPTLPLVAAGLRSDSPLARSVSPVQQLQASSSTNSSATGSPVKSSADTCQPAKLSRFGLAAAKASGTAAAAATVAADTAAHAPGQSAMERAVSASAVTSAGASPLVAAAMEPDVEGASQKTAPVTESCHLAPTEAAAATADLSNASSLAAPDTPPVTEAATAPEAACSLDATPTAADAATVFAAEMETQNLTGGAASNQALQVEDSIEQASSRNSRVHNQTAASSRSTVLSSEKAAADVAAAVGGNASALLSKLRSEKQHQVLLATGRSAVQYVPSYMSSNPANALRQIATAQRSSSSNAASITSSSRSSNKPETEPPAKSRAPRSVAAVAAPAGVTPFIVACRKSASGTSNAAAAAMVFSLGSAGVDDTLGSGSTVKQLSCTSCSSTGEQHQQERAPEADATVVQTWDAQVLLEPLPQQLFEAASGTLSLVTAESATDAPLSRTTSGCSEVQPGLVQQRVESLDNLYQAGRADLLASAAVPTPARLQGKRSAPPGSGVAAAAADGAAARPVGPWLLKRHRSQLEQHAAAEPPAGNSRSNEASTVTTAAPAKAKAPGVALNGIVQPPMAVAAEDITSSPAAAVAGCHQLSDVPSNPAKEQPTIFCFSASASSVEGTAVKMRTPGSRKWRHVQHTTAKSKADDAADVYVDAGGCADVSSLPDQLADEVLHAGPATTAAASRGAKSFEAAAASGADSNDQPTVAHQGAPLQAAGAVSDAVDAVVQAATAAAMEEAVHSAVSELLLQPGTQTSSSTADCAVERGMCNLQERKQLELDSCPDNSSNCDVAAAVMAQEREQQGDKALCASSAVHAISSLQQGHSNQQTPTVSDEVDGATVEQAADAMGWTWVLAKVPDPNKPLAGSSVGKGIPQRPLQQQPGALEVSSAACEVSPEPSLQEVLKQQQQLHQVHSGSVVASVQDATGSRTGSTAEVFSASLGSTGAREVLAAAADASCAAVRLSIRVPGRRLSEQHLGRDLRSSRGLEDEHASVQGCTERDRSVTSSTASSPTSSSSSSSLDEELQCDLALPAAGARGTALLMELGVAIDAAAVSRATTRQHKLLKQRQLLRLQHQRRQLDVAAWAAAQQQQQTGKSPHVGESSNGDVDVAQQQLGQQGRWTPFAAATRPAAAGTAAAATPVAAAESCLRESRVGPQCAMLPQQYNSSDCSRVAAWFAPELSAEPAAESTLAVSQGELVHVASCMSLNSHSNMSWAAWSTTSSINGCPKIAWWGEDGQGFFSEKQRRRYQQHKLQQQQAVGGAAAAVAPPVDEKPVGAASSSSIKSSSGNAWWKRFAVGRK